MSHLPHDLVVDILRRLPVKSLVRFKGVCKSWRHTIESRQFIKIHSDHQSTDKIILRTRILKFPTPTRTGISKFNYLYHMFDPNFNGDDDEDEGNNNLRLATTLGMPPMGRYHDYDFALCSCDGLLLFAYQMDILVWNPCTRKFKSISRPKPFWTISQYKTVYGFGYDASIDDYKIVVIFQVKGNKEVSIWVFALKTNTWRSVACNVTIGKIYNWRDHQSAAFLNGSVHFRARGDFPTPTIVRFSLAEERMVQISFPHYYLNPLHPMVLGGKLSLTRYVSYSPLGSPEFEIWSMMDYCDCNSWTKIVSITCGRKSSFSWPDSCPFRPIYIMENGNVLLSSDSGRLLAYDKEKRTFREVIKDSMIGRFPIDCFEFGPLMFKESFVSPNND